MFRPPGPRRLSSLRRIRRPLLAARRLARLWPRLLLELRLPVLPWLWFLRPWPWWSSRLRRRQPVSRSRSLPNTRHPQSHPLWPRPRRLLPLKPPPHLPYLRRRWSSPRPPLRLRSPLSPPSSLLLQPFLLRNPLPRLLPSQSRKRQSRPRKRRQHPPHLPFPFAASSCRRRDRVRSTKRRRSFPAHQLPLLLRPAACSAADPYLIAGLPVDRAIIPSAPPVARLGSSRPDRGLNIPRAPHPVAMRDPVGPALPEAVPASEHAPDSERHDPAASAVRDPDPAEHRRPERLPVRSVPLRRAAAAASSIPRRRKAR